jgi:hypothetical protein
MRSESISSISEASCTWILREPAHSPTVPYLTILCGGWSYGILPYCGPGRVDAIWKSEKAFLDLFSEYLTEKDFLPCPLHLQTDLQQLLMMKRLRVLPE